MTYLTMFISVVAAGVSVGVALSTVLIPKLEVRTQRLRHAEQVKQARLAREEKRKQRLEKERFELRGGLK